MKKSLLSILRCPKCSGTLSVKIDVEHDGEIETGTLTCAVCSSTFSIDRFVPRFVPVDNYASNFGLQWNAFSRTQLDSHTGSAISRTRFFRQSGWSPDEMRGKRVLDVGCGAGRFAEVALSTGADVVALDYSRAVDACRSNLYPNPRLNVVQGDVYKLPFAEGSFDFVYCFGVLQHTPDVAAAFLALPRPLKPAGKLAVDIYQSQLRNVFSGKYWVRPVTRRIPASTLFSLVQRLVPVFLPVSLLLGRVPLVGKKLRQLLPISNYEGVHPLTPEQVREWAVLDTFDMLSPAHDHPQTPRSLSGWFQEAKLKDVEIFKDGHLVGRGVK
jgi:SAM-dependent methyltransferase